MPAARSLNRTLVESFFTSNGFHAISDGATASSNATLGVFYYPPVSAAIATTACAAPRSLTIGALRIGSKDGLCRASRRAARLWPAFAKAMPHPHCLVYPEDEAEIRSELLGHSPRHGWLFKRTAASARSYGGQGISLFRPGSNTTTTYVPARSPDGGATIATT